MARKPAAGTRERVLDTAATLFHLHGIRAVGMQQIIDAAGCGKSLLYREFPSKTDLVASYLERSRQNLEGPLRRAAAPGDDAATRLLALIQALTGQVGAADYRGCPFRRYLTEFPDEIDQPSRIAHAFLSDTRTLIEELVHELDHPRPQVLAEQIWLIVEGLYAAASHPNGSAAVQAALPLVHNLVHQP